MDNYFVGTRVVQLGNCKRNSEFDQSVATVYPHLVVRRLNFVIEQSKSRGIRSKQISLVRSLL